MAAKRRNSAGRWEMVFEEMRSQNRANLEHVEMMRISLEQKIDRLDQDTRARDANLEMAFRELSRKFDNLVVPLDARVTAIEKRLG